LFVCHAFLFYFEVKKELYKIITKIDKAINITEVTAAIGELYNISIKFEDKAVSVGREVFPKYNGLTKALIHKANANNDAEYTPGKLNGNITRQKTCHLLAPKLIAASSNLKSIFNMTLKMFNTTKASVKWIRPIITARSVPKRFARNPGTPMIGFINVIARPNIPLLVKRIIHPIVVTMGPLNIGNARTSIAVLPKLFDV